MSLLTVADKIILGLSRTVREHCLAFDANLDPEEPANIQDMDVDDLVDMVKAKYGSNRIGHKMFCTYVHLYTIVKNCAIISGDRKRLLKYAEQIVFWSGYMACEDANDGVRDDDLMLDMPLSVRRRVLLRGRFYENSLAHFEHYITQ